jgi:DNA-binding transcriptional MerR regulator
MRNGEMTIGELASLAGVPASTVRYYERSRLMAPAGRTASNYRLYDAAALERLRFIRGAQTAGLTLADIKVLLHHKDGLSAPCREVRELLEQRLTHIEAALRELKHVRGALSSYLEICRQSVAEDPCQVMEKLGGVSD